MDERVKNDTSMVRCDCGMLLKVEPSKPDYK